MTSALLLLSYPLFSFIDCPQERTFRFNSDIYLFQNSFIEFNLKIESCMIQLTHLNYTIHWFLVYSQIRATITRVDFRTGHHI